MISKTEFEHLMNCGHGRCEVILGEGDISQYKDIVLKGCLDDISFDMQSEGSRGVYMYNLALRFEDADYFYKPAAEKFFQINNDDDWNVFCHLCDFLGCYAADGYAEAEELLNKKYTEMYTQLMANEEYDSYPTIRDNYEYIAITIMQQNGIDRLISIAEDMGAYAVKLCNEYEDIFEWFVCCARNRFGEKVFNSTIEEKSVDSENLKFFCKTVNDDCNCGSNYPKPEVLTAEQFYAKVNSGTVQVKDVVAMKKRADEQEKIKLAEMALAEQNEDKKEKLLRAFTSDDNVFPIDAKQIIEYISSPNEKLRDTVLDVLSYVQGDYVHELAVQLLKEENNLQAVCMLIYNYRDEDKELLAQTLNSLKVDYDDCTWHGAVMSILAVAENGNIPDEAIMFIYEKSLCSCCRRRAVEEMERRGMLTEDIVIECRFDCNDEIREFAEKYKKQSL